MNGVVDGDHFHIGIRRSGTEHEHSDTTEAIDAQLCLVHGQSTKKRFFFCDTRWKLQGVQYDQKKNFGSRQRQYVQKKKNEENFSDEANFETDVTTEGRH